MEKEGSTDAVNMRVQTQTLQYALLSVRSAAATAAAAPAPACWSSGKNSKQGRSEITQK